MPTAFPFPLHGRYARISRFKLGGLPGRHEGVLTPSGMVAHTTFGRHLEMVSFFEFAQGLEVLLEAELSPQQNQAVGRRLVALLNKREPYDPLFGNCETNSRKIMGEPGISWQVVVAGAALIGFYALTQG